MGNKQEIEEAIQFGRDIDSLNGLLGHIASVFDSTVWPETMKRKTAAGLESQRALVQNMAAEVYTKYSGIKAAEEAKTYALKRMAEIEEMARPYL